MSAGLNCASCGIVRPEFPRSIAYEAMDDTMDFITQAIQSRLSDDQIDALNDRALAATRKTAIEEMRHKLRRIWSDAIERQHALSTPKVPTVEDGRVVLQPITVVIGSLMETQWSVSLLSDALRMNDIGGLHIYLRTAYVDAYADQLTDIRWAE